MAVDTTTALVIGATSGIGRETALGFARQGARVALAARSRPALDLVAADCRAAGAADVLVHPVDIGERAQVRALTDAALARFGALDVTVAAAAVTAFGRFDDIPAEVFDRVVRTDLIGTANVAREALRHLRRRGHGHLVVVGSLLGRTAAPYQAPYVMSKFALDALIRILRQENRDRPGVAVHGVYPGPVDTPIYPNAGNYTGRRASVPPPPYDPATVAARIVRLAGARGHRDRDVGWVNAPLTAAFRLLPGVFDAVVGPLMRALSLSGDPIPPTPGNVSEPAERAAGAGAGEPASRPPR